MTWFPCWTGDVADLSPTGLADMIAGIDHALRRRLLRRAALVAAERLKNYDRPALIAWAPAIVCFACAMPGGSPVSCPTPD